jgi:hypothetical protein
MKQHKHTMGKVLYIIPLAALMLTVTVTTTTQTAAQCDWETPPGSNEPTCVPVPNPWPVPWPPIIFNPQPLPPIGNWMMLNPQPLPPIGNWMMLNPQPLPPIVLDKSLFTSNAEIKISPQMNGSIIISTTNSTIAPNYNATNSTNQSS